MLNKKMSLLIGLALFSCSQEEFLQESQPIQVSSHTVSLDHALENLKAFIESYDGSQARSEQSSGRMIANIHTLSLDNPMTKTLAEDLECNKLLYLVNFEDNQGYAVLAADDRIDESILAVTEQGSISEEEMQVALEAGVRRIFPQYPLTGPGIIYHDSDSTSSAINPNTFQLYNAEVNDFYVGNLVVDETPLPVPAIPLVHEMIVAHSLGQIQEHDTLPELPDLPLITTEEVHYTYFEDNVSNLLSFSKRWSQSEYIDSDSIEYQFNKYFPTVTNFMATETRRAFVGCFPLAISKLLAYHSKSMLFPEYDYSIVWSPLTQGIYAYRQYIDMLARGLKYIADRCYAGYWYNGTFTYPYQARRYMGEFFSDVESVSYSTESVLQLLDDNKPVIIYSIPDSGWLDYDLLSSHAWNIDGYKTQCNKTIQNVYRDGQLIETNVYVDRVIMVHCDFGWAGNSNGYFVSGIFDMTDPRVIYDNPDSDDHLENTTNYKWYLHILKYNL